MAETFYWFEMSLQKVVKQRRVSFWVLLFSSFYPEKGFFYFFGEFFLIRCEVKGQGCPMWTDCKAL